MHGERLRAEVVSFEGYRSLASPLVAEPCVPMPHESCLQLWGHHHRTCTDQHMPRLRPEYACSLI